VMYPAGFPGVVATTGSTTSHTFWSAGESGTYVDLAAPAESIESASDTGQYLQSNGTSYSAAYVSATAALIASRYPKLTSNQIIQRLILTASDAKEPNNQWGYGEVNPLAALTSRLTSPTTTNPLLTRPDATAQHHNSNTAILAAAIGGTLLLLVAAAVFLTRHQLPLSRGRENRKHSEGPVSAPKKSKARR
jgi:subtilisin family serine protease